MFHIMCCNMQCESWVPLFHPCQWWASTHPFFWKWILSQPQHEANKLATWNLHWSCWNLILTYDYINDAKHYQVMITTWKKLHVITIIKHTIKHHHIQLDILSNSILLKATPIFSFSSKQLHVSNKCLWLTNFWNIM
jgi:hypothetical protein